MVAKDHGLGIQMKDVVFRVVHLETNAWLSLNAQLLN